MTDRYEDSDAHKGVYGKSNLDSDYAAEYRNNMWKAVSANRVGARA